MKHGILSGLASLSLIFTLSFSQIGFAGPGPDIGGDKSPSFSDSDQNTDIDWGNEAELLSFLQTASDQDIQAMSDATYQQIIHDVKAGCTNFLLGGIIAVSGGAVIITATLINSKIATKGPLIVASAAIIVAGGVVITWILNHPSGVMTRDVSVDELKQIVGEDLANKIDALQQILSQLDQKLDPLTVSLPIPQSYRGDPKRTLILFPESEGIPMTVAADVQPGHVHIRLSLEAAEAFKKSLKKKILEKLLGMNFALTTVCDHMGLRGASNILEQLRDQTVSFPNVVFREDSRSQNLYDNPASAYVRQTYEFRIGSILDYPSDRTELTWNWPVYEGGH